MAKILIVDDQSAVRGLLKELLEIDGHIAEAVESGEEALAKLQGGGFQLVTLDVDMPDMNGMEVLKRIRLDPKLSKLPVLMCTAFNMMEALNAAFQEGANGYMVKPFDLATLKKCVEKALPPTRDDQVTGF